MVNIEVRTHGDKPEIIAVLEQLLIEIQRATMAREAALYYSVRTIT